MANTLQDIKTALSGGGARPNLFEIDIPSLPTGVPSATTWAASTFKILCKAGGLPASNMGVVEVPFRGRTFKVAGDRTFETWTVTVINDDDFAIRKPLEEWMQLVGQYGDGSGSKKPGDYMKDATVTQFSRNVSNIGDGSTNSVGTGLLAARTYKFVDIFPTNLSQIDLSYDSSDTIEEFTCEFQVQYWYPDSVTKASTATATATATTTTTTT
jgi:hypothetical protein